jgi:hypothetical protein
MTTYSSFKQITTVNIPEGGVSGSDLEDNIALPGEDAVTVPKGDTSERGTNAAGKFRFNTELGKFEGNDGTAWGTVGGGATGGGSDAVFVENDQTVTENYTIPATKNAMSTGPITIDSGVTVTVSTGARWVVL